MPWDNVAGRNVIPHAQESETLARDVPCVGCNYNLRGLSLSARCPECGTPVCRSQEGLALQGADVRWLKRVWLGLCLLVWAPAPFVVLVIVMVGIPLTVEGVRARWWEGVPFGSSWGTVGLWVSLHAFWAYCVAGIYLLTVAEPRSRLDEDALNLRRVLRVSAILVMPAVTELLESWACWLVPPLHPGWCENAAGLCNIVVCVLVGIYVSRFGARIGWQGAEQKTQVLAIGVGSCMLLVVVIPRFARVMGDNVTDVPSPFSLLYLFVWGVTLVLLVMYVAMLNNYKGEFARARRLAASQY